MRHCDDRTFLTWQLHNETWGHPITHPCLSDYVTDKISKGSTVHTLQRKMIAWSKNLQWKYTLFYKQSSFSVQPQSCLTFPWTELRMLLNTYNHHHTRTLFIFTIFVSMSRPRSVCVVSMWSFFHFHLHFHYG